MPWYNAVTGEHVPSPSDDRINRDELVYKPSMYTKEELPTWAEVYEEFYLGKQYIYDPENPNDQTPDLYWKIPHKKFLIAVVCNQFNKMLFEDGLMQEVVKKLNKQLKYDIISIQFVCGKDVHNVGYVKFDKVHEIYTIPMPNGKPNPFMLSRYHRVNVADFKGTFGILPLIYIKTSMVNANSIYIPTGGEKFDIVIDVMMDYFKSYFTGDIGWKDSEGKLIEGDPGCRDCTGAGYCAKK